MANYTFTPNAFDEAVDRRSKNNNISMDEAKSGRRAQSMSGPSMTLQNCSAPLSPDVARRTASCPGIAIAASSRPAHSPNIRAPHMQTTVRLQLKNSDGWVTIRRQTPTTCGTPLCRTSNLDLKCNRYGPWREWTLERRQAAAPSGVTNGNTFINQRPAAGVQGSQVAAGLASNNNNNGGGGATRPSPRSDPSRVLDPVIQNLSLYEHITTPQPNTTQSQNHGAGRHPPHGNNYRVQQRAVGRLCKWPHISYSCECHQHPQPVVVPVLNFYLRHNRRNGLARCQPPADSRR